jgi:Mu-like prophage I protein
MKTVMAIAEREDVSPKEGKSKYGDVKFADEKNKKYPLDTEAHVRAALSYWGMPKNRAKYSSEDQKTIGGKIRAAAKRLGIGVSDDGDGEGKTESSLVYAASIDLQGQTPEEIVYMPKGEAITIKPKSHGREVKVKVDASAAEVLQTALEKRLSDQIQPYAGYDHDGKAASFHPKEFRWDDERGVILAVDWTEGGKQDVTGRNYSYFSPTFMLSKSGKVAGLPDTGEVGSLVNNPAFRDRKMKIAASAADDNEGENMAAKVAERLVELEVITAEQADDEDMVVKAVTGLHEALATVQAANARLVSENTALAAKAIEVQKAEASTIIEAAIAEGKIGAKDKTSIEFWTGQLVSSPETAKKVIASLPANPLLKKVIDVKVGDTKRVAAGQSEADLVQAQHLAIHEIQESHPNLSYTDAFNKAKREHPEVFPVEA